MKILKSLLLLVLAIAAVACSNNDSSSDQLGPPPAPIDPSTLNAPSQNSASVPGVVPGQKHYICPNNCANSGGDAQGNCPVCGTAYVHNAAYHAQPPANTPQQQPSPAMNAAGVYHYTCTNGCAGGAGSAGICPSCGGQLAHNQAYHDTPAGGSTGGATSNQKSPLFVN